MTSAKVRPRDIVRLQFEPTSVCIAFAQQWVSRVSGTEKSTRAVRPSSVRQEHREGERLLVN